MHDRFALDRLIVPKFYTVNDANNGHRSPIGTVFAESSEHGTPGWITLGYVSIETPFGQGTYLGFPLTEIRQATQKEVWAALARIHPHGLFFRPANQEAMNASFHLVMASAIGNWTEGQSSDHEAVLPVSKQEIVDFRAKAIAQHDALMARWYVVVWSQIVAIKKAFDTSNQLSIFQ